nr:hybrid signal transduction histidine kinase M [Tanacetum cinerariifolium]
MTGSNATPVILLSDKLSTVTHNQLLTCVPVKLDIDNWNYASWVYFFETFCKGYEDNKRSRTIALKAELRSLKLGDMSIDAYFMKIESLATILTSLGSPVSSDNVVTYALEGLPDKYDHGCAIISHREPFLDLKKASSMLTTEDMRLKSESQSLPVDSSSSSPIVLVTQSGNTRRSFTPQLKTSRPCYNFARGSCRFGDTCRFVHDPYMQAKYSNKSPWSSSSNNNSGVSNNGGSSRNELLV